MDETLRSFAKDELERGRGAFRRTLVVGALLAALALGYLSWLRSTVAQFVEPANLTDLLTGVAMTTIPRASAELEGQLTAAAPALADSLATQLVEAVAFLRVRLEAKLGDLVDGMAKAAAGDLADGLRQELTRTPGADPRARLDAAMTTLIGRLEKASGEDPESPVDAVVGNSFFKGFNDSVTVLREVHGDLRRILAGKGLTQEEIMEKRLIETWLAFIR